MSGGFRVVIGPVAYADYGPHARFETACGNIFSDTPVRRKRIALRCAGDPEKEDIPFCRLGQSDAPARLGWNSWARVAPAQQDSADAVVTEREGSAISA